MERIIMKKYQFESRKRYVLMKTLRCYYPSFYSVNFATLTQLLQPDAKLCPSSYKMARMRPRLREAMLITLVEIKRRLCDSQASIFDYPILDPFWGRLSCTAIASFLLPACINMLIYFHLASIMFA